MSVSTAIGENGGWTVVAVAGDLDITGAPQLREALLGVVAGGARRVVLDLQEVGFVDSTGLGVLVAAHKRLRSSDGELRIAASPEAVLRPVRATGLHLILELRPTIEAAVTDD